MTEEMGVQAERVVKGAPQPQINRGRDIVAGLSIAGLLLPEAVAYSSIANLPPQAGIIALFAGMLCYFLIGKSRFAIVSATSSSAAVLAAATASFASDDPAHRLALAFGLILITGVLFLLAAAMRLGSITDFIAKPVLRGFAFGLAIVIIIKQLATVVSVSPEHSDLFRFLPELLSQFAHWNPVGIAIAGIALLLLVIFSRFQHVPGGLIVIGLGIAAGQWLDLAHYNVSLVGTIQLQLERPSVPELSRADWLRLGELGFAMAMILYSESYGSIRSFAMKHGDPVAPNRDLLALGAANLLSSLFHGMPVGAGYSGTSANEAAGASSRLSGVVAALVVLGLVLTLLPAIALTPEPVLAAIVIHAVSHTLNPAVFRPYFAWRRDRLVIIAAVVCVLYFGVLNGLLASIALSILMLMKRLSDSRVSELGRLGEGHDFVRIVRNPAAQAIPGMRIFRPDQPLFFANADKIFREVRHQMAMMEAPLHTVIISLEESPDLDSSTLETLKEFVAYVTQQQQRLVLTRLKTSSYEVLTSLLPEKSEALLLCELSVDDAVQLALKTQEESVAEEKTRSQLG